ncbi:MAG TPA: hypothetical protein VGM88_10515 [Kofleriaceae bacterium]|jgi:hypothetical protein
MRVLALLLVLGWGNLARADGVYVSDALGATRIQGDVGVRLPRAVRARVAIGVRRDHWAFEGFLVGDLAWQNLRDEVTSFAPSSNARAFAEWGATLKYIEPLGGRFEAYSHLDIGEASTGGFLDGYGGPGISGGVGIQLKGKVSALGALFLPLAFTHWGPRVTGAIFLDASYGMFRMQNSEPGSRTMSAQTSSLLVGLSLGSDF